MEEISLEQKEKPTYADISAYLNIISNDEIIGSISLLSVATMNEAKIKHTNCAIFEMNFDKLVPLDSRTNKYEVIPELPLVEKDLSILVNEDVTWEQIYKTIKAKVREVEFIEEYRGNQIPKGQKSIMLRVKIGNDEKTLTTEEINNQIYKILKALNHTCGAILREE